MIHFLTIYFNLFMFELAERIQYDGLTYQEMCKMAGGGDGPAENNDTSTSAATNLGTTGNFEGVHNENVNNNEYGTTEQEFEDAIAADDALNAEYDDYSDFGGLSTGGFKGLETSLGLDSVEEFYDDLSQFDESYDVNTTFNTVTGVTTIENTSSFLGVDYTYDTHYVDGVALGTLDELSADVLEALGFNVNEVNVDIASGIAGLISGIVLGQIGGIASMIGGVNNVAASMMSMNIAVDVAYSNRAINMEQRNGLKATIAVMNLGYATYDFMQTLASISAMKNQMTTSGKVMAFTIAAIEATQLYDRFNSVVSQYGLNPEMINELDVSNYDNFSNGNPDEGIVSAMSIYHDFSKWYIGNRVTLGTSNDALDAEDIFKRMAGGVMYNAFFGGSNYFHPLNPIENSNMSIGKDIKTDKFAMNSIQGGDEYMFNKSQMVDTRSQVGLDLSIMSHVKSRIYNKILNLQEESNTLIDEYQSKVDGFNNSADSLKTQATYDAVTIELADLNIEITALNDQISELATRL